jgi:hypothetical protein
MLFPSHCQRSSVNGMVELPPPNNSVWPRTVSYVIAALGRGDGAFVVVRWLQFAPSHSHVSASGVPAAFCPPNSTIRLRPESVAMAWCERGVGLFAGASWVQVAPFQRQVSLRVFRLRPPIKSTSPEGSAAIAA